MVTVQISELLAGASTAYVARRRTPGSVDDLRSMVASTVLSHRGVVRIEPVLPEPMEGRRGVGTISSDGILVSVRGRVVDVELTISTRAGHPAFRTVTELHAQLSGLFVGRGFICDEMKFNVVSIEAVD